MFNPFAKYVRSTQKKNQQHFSTNNYQLETVSKNKMPFPITSKTKKHQVINPPQRAKSSKKNNI